MIDRRTFLIGSLSAAAAACAARVAPGPSAVPAPAPAPGKTPPKTILILGGTGFLGPHIVDAARARGHTVTLFNRGKTHPGLFPDVEKLRGDRDGHLEALVGRRWDAVIDPSGYVPRLVRASAELLAPSVGHYVFISTISVYKDDDKPNATEEAPVGTLPDPTVEKIDNGAYGPLKALCEQAAERALPGRVLNVRPGLIVGPGDTSGRFTHWPSRMADGGDVLAPGDGTTPVQWIDVRDLATWLVHSVEQRTVGTMNAFGPDPGQPMRAVLEACNAAAGGKARLVWVPADFLDKQGVHGWVDLPMWIDAHGDDAGFGTMSNARAVAAGLVQRPIGETARATLAWLATLPPETRAKVASSGIARDREAAVIAAWRATHAT
jgi:2'-hydroxyisoflavone reductase